MPQPTPTPSLPPDRHGGAPLRILMTGASGFLGSRLSSALRAQGHELVHVSRRAPPAAHRGEPRAAGPTPGRLSELQGDFSSDQRCADWLPRLQGVDVVINAAGILRETRTQRFDDVHVRGPIALFDACAQAGVRHVLQVSALGADEGARSAYHLSKRAADQHLLALPLRASVVQPALLYGPGGASARLFTGLAALPWIPVPGDGQQAVQPLHVDDAVAALLALVREGGPTGRTVLAGPKAMPLSGFLQQLRAALGLGPTRVLRIPAALVDLAAWAGERLPGALLDLDTWQMLQAGNTGDASAVQRLLGHAPRAPAEFVAPAEAPAQRTLAQLGWLLPLLRLSLALVWLVTAWVSIAVFPQAQSLALLERSGVPAPWAPLLLWGAALLDLALGLATLFLHRWRALWRVQALLILFYTLVITLRLPEFWAHPYGPVLKNLPMLALLCLLDTLSPPRRAARRTAPA